MLDVTIQKELSITSNDVYEICSMAIQMSESNGFVSSFVLSRAAYSFLVMFLYEDKKELIASLSAENVLNCWDYLVKDGIIEQMQKEYKEEVKYLGEVLQTWYEEFIKYSYSVRGLVDLITSTTGKSVEEMIETVKGQEAKEILQTAKQWGIDNSLMES